MRTVQPTQRRLDEARRDGTVARSADLTAAAGALGALGVLVVAGPVLLDELTQMTGGMLGSAGAEQGEWAGGLWQATAGVVYALGLMFAALAALAFAANVLQVGFVVSARPMRLDFGRLWSAGRLASKRSAMRLVMTLAKIAAAGAVAYMTIRAEMANVVAATTGPLGNLAGRAGYLAMTLGLRVGLVLLALAGVDWLYQRWQHRRDLMMTRRELEDELKQTRGGGADARRRRNRRGGRADRAATAGPGKGENDG